MRIMIALFLVIVTLSLAQAPSLCAVTYRYAAICDDAVCLIGADGKTVLKLAGRSEMRVAGGWLKDAYWDDLTVSPKNRTIVASPYVTPSIDPPRDDFSDFELPLYRIDPRTGSRQALSGSTGRLIPYFPVWLNDDVLLLEDIDASVSACNTRTNTTIQVVPPSYGCDFRYSSLVPSISGKLLLTIMPTNKGNKLSVNDLARGERTWRTDTYDGLPGLAGAVWSDTDKWLYVAFHKDEDKDANSPGGVWRFDALTGKQYPWKYANQSIDSIYSVPKQKILVIEYGDSIDLLRMSDGQLLGTLKVSEIGGVLGAFFQSGDRWILCGKNLVVEMNSSGKRIKSQRVRGLVSSTVRFSPAHNALMFGAVVNGGTEDDKTGVLDLKTGRITRFAVNDWRIEWLPRDIVR